MLLQQIQQPYIHTLSLLRKIDLIRLSLEFKLPADRTDVILRDRLRVYLNSHSETLYKNPRYRPLYPQLRRPTQPALSQAPEACHLDHHSSSPTVVKSSDSSTQSCGSWNSNNNAPVHLFNLLNSQWSWHLSLCKMQRISTLPHLHLFLYPVQTRTFPFFS